MSSKNYLLKNARIVNPASGSDAIGDLAVAAGRFIRPEDLPADYEILDLTGRIAAPGFIDIHVHLREPGQLWKEDIVTATRGAAAGGFTTVLAMPNTVPAIDTPERYQEFQKLLEGRAAVHVLQSAAVSVGRKGEEITDIPAFAELGVPALSDDGSTPQNDEIMAEIARQAAAADLVIIDHCEDYHYSRPGVMHEGAVSAELGLPGQPKMGELRIVQRDISLARKTGCRMHLQHLSCGESVQMIRAAREEGLHVTGEITPHHLLLTDQAVKQFGVNAKMAPPLREEKDRLALEQALIDGVVSVIATDHAPHSAEEKGAGMLKAPFGIIGLEAAVPLTMTELYQSGKMSLLQYVALFTTGPAKVLHRPDLGRISIGGIADLTILDPNAEGQINIAEFQSKSRNCPYDGMPYKGRAEMVMVQGKMMRERGDASLA